MWKILLFQAVTIMAVAMAAGLSGGFGTGRPAALSALAGGAAYFLPNLLFALRLMTPGASAGRHFSGPIIFLVGEALKLSAIIAILLILSRIIEIYWPALLAGLFAVLIVNLFALLLKT
ncbi:MAG: ATP synthase subunit I [Rhodocyclaceae bacterium]